MPLADLKLLDLIALLPFIDKLRNAVFGPFEVDVKHVLYDHVLLPRGDGTLGAISVSRLTGGILNRSSAKVSIRRLEAQMLNAGACDPRVHLNQFDGPKLLEPGEVHMFNLALPTSPSPVHSLIIVFASNKEKAYPVRETIDHEPQ